MIEHPNDIATVIVNSVYQMRRHLGPGLSEKVYETILARDLVRNAMVVERQKHVSFDYDGLWFENGLILDLLVNHSVIVEIKSARRLTPGDYKQVLTYLRLTGLKLGLLVNFGAPTMKESVKRIVHGL